MSYIFVLTVQRTVRIRDRLLDVLSFYFENIVCNVSLTDLLSLFLHRILAVACRVNRILLLLLPCGYVYIWAYGSLLRLDDT